MGGGGAVWLFVHEHYQPATERRPGFIRSLQVGLSSPTVRPLLVVLFLIQVSSAIVFPILPLVVQHLAAAGDPVKLYAGLAFGVTAMFSALAAVAYSRVADRSGYRRILIYCCFGAAAFFLPQALAANVGQLLLLRAGLGIFFGALIPATNAIVAMVSPRQSHGSVFGLASSVTALGTAIGPLVGSAIAASFGLSSIFFATAAVLGLLGLWVTVTVREPAPVD